MQAQVREWIRRDPDPETRAELERLVATGDQAELARRFDSRLAFGTAGLRGVLGAGPNRMNRLVVRETTAGLASYVLNVVDDAKTRGIVIGFDGRRGSRIFARDVAGVLVARGFEVYLGEDLLATPVCAFAVKELGAAAGVVITASHNPPEYNGYKVYWHNGAQIIPPHDAGIAAAIDEESLAPVPFVDFEDGQVTLLGDDIIAKYLAGVRGLSHRAASPARAELGIAYTPLHGVGARLAETALAQAGFTKVRTVSSQREPDGDFPTVRFPNPEEPGAMDAVIALAQEMDADLAMANDPDADRLAVAVRAAGGGYQMLTGNQIGVLLGADAMSTGDDVAVATTVVSSRMLGEMAAKKGCRYFETLTGLKWITNGAIELEQAHENVRFAFGYEEALGYTIGALVRDKDGISALVLFAELAADLGAAGKTMLDRLEELYREHGLWLTAQQNLALSPTGSTIGEKLRRAIPEKIAGRDIESVADFATGERRFMTGHREPIDLPESDVLVFTLTDGSRAIVRPSGTEPKLKCYYEVRETVAADEPLAAAQCRAQANLDTLIREHQRELAAL